MKQKTKLSQKPNICFIKTKTKTNKIDDLLTRVIKKIKVRRGRERERGRQIKMYQ